MHNMGKDWEVIFHDEFEPERSAILLAGGDKTGVDQRRFYRKLISIADKRFDAHLAAIGFKKGR
jgi:hypothetical protein